MQSQCQWIANGLTPINTMANGNKDEIKEEEKNVANSKKSPISTSKWRKQIIFYVAIEMNRTKTNGQIHADDVRESRHITNNIVDPFDHFNIYLYFSSKIFICRQNLAQLNPTNVSPLSNWHQSQIRPKKRWAIRRPDNSAWIRVYLYWPISFNILTGTIGNMPSKPNHTACGGRISGRWSTQSQRQA